MQLGAGRFSPFPGDPEKTYVDYVVCIDPKIYFVPQRLVDTCIAYTVHRDSVFARKKLKEQKRQQESTQISEATID
ncbi:unnamed protein product [Gongylonema pulchrum]|uniref:Uncharacterized protein n=1 Tax=Gongylonema pulchrum TaxID=637853 RepID=A0A183DJE5_9BILA|nr:unnamed protein product [Gongylonema pulchrum]